MVVFTANIINRAFGETPMRASPADCKSALRLGGALCRVVVQFPLGFPSLWLPAEGEVVVSYQKQLVAWWCLLRIL